VHINEMHDDFYEFLEKQMALVGRKTKRTYRIGQPIKVKLLSVDVDQKEVNFKIMNPQAAPKTDLLKKYGSINQPQKRSHQHNFQNKNQHRNIKQQRGGFRPFKEKFKKTH
jgi:ribonuclease R